MSALSAWVNKTHVGDCRQLLKDMAAAGVRAQMCVTSPPYYGLRDYGMPGQIGLEPSFEEYVEQLVSVFRLVWELLAEDGTLWLNLGDSYALNGEWGGPIRGKPAAALPGSQNTPRRRSRYTGIKPKDLLGVPWEIAFALRADGWYLRVDVIWHKPNPKPESATDRPSRAHEYVFLLSKSPKYYYDAASIAEPSVSLDEHHSSYRPNSARIAVEGRKEYSAKHAMSARSYPTRRNRRSVWSITTVPFAAAHFATFPPALVEPCILAGSRPLDVVLDPFMGSGTTEEVATNLGRQFVGCELNPNYEELRELRRTTLGMPF
jgi:DNA modification methylase